MSSQSVTKIMSCLISSNWILTTVFPKHIVCRKISPVCRQIISIFHFDVKSTKICYLYVEITIFLCWKCVAKRFFWKMCRQPKKVENLWSANTNFYFFWHGSSLILVLCDLVRWIAISFKNEVNEIHSIFTWVNFYLRATYVLPRSIWNFVRDCIFGQVSNFMFYSYNSS